MITQDQLPDLLHALSFSKKSASYTKTIGSAMLEINTFKQEIIYPEGVQINERQTCNFSSNENFVVFECVHRLLEKGYKPEHIELEPKWKVGHGASGGRADILVKDNSGKPLLIIECKTAGIEFKRAWNKTLHDGDQLFSYAQQTSETQFLCLYASNFEAGALSFQSHLIAHRDNPKYLDDNPQFKSFKSASDVKERFAVWRDTYKLDYRTQGLFETNIQPYHVGKDKYTLADLHSIAAADQQKKYHEFATILRQHNVSGRENAFDKLINLFLCKLVDETENPQDLKFYWKGVAFDSHFDLIDRLQKLYQQGMGKFLGETITYIDQSAVQNAMRFIRQNPDATQKAVWNLFLQQKFFTNNDFSLIDVHNEKLFYQNAEVLLKILQMWQDIRLTNNEGNNQFLGDMFEGFLDQGVKQSEGQYFTPMPICRFIFMSLPLQSMVQDGAIPRAIDYACGAGHFLNELALQIKPLITQNWQGEQIDLIDHLKEQHRAIYGIEKEYRLSKVAKVSAFMYGQQEINICYGDGLVQQHATFPKIQNNSFDMVVANPPYSVRGFLETLPEEERAAYSLSGTVDKLDSFNSIETFFIERAKQLLKAGGVAALILPSSILSNGGGIYIKTREILLQYFDFVAVAELGSGTFGKTGTNTVTLFLRRKKTLPDTAEHYRERVAQWFGADESQSEYKDAHLVEKYAAHIGVPLEDYKTLMAGDATGPWTQADYFEVYTNAFNDSAEVKNLYKQKAFKALSEAEQTQEFDRRYLRYVQAQERDKLYYFVLASDQPNAVLIIKSPSDNKAQKAFLGYEWSASKGDEGIKLVKNAKGHHQTHLYDEVNRNNDSKLNRLIADNFDGRLGAIPAALSEFASTARLVNLLNFSRAEFEKQIVLKISSSKSTSQWPQKRLAVMAEINPSTVNPIDAFGDMDFVYIDIGSVDAEAGTVSFLQKLKPSDAPSRARREVINGDILLSTVRPNLKAFALLDNLPDAVLASTGFAVLRANSNLALPKYIFEKLFSTSLQEQMISKMGKGQYPSINQTDIESLMMVCPPLDVQRKIVSECEAVDFEVTEARIIIVNNKNYIENAICDIFKDNYEIKKLSNSAVALLNPSKAELRNVDDETLVTFIEMSAVSEDGFVVFPVSKTLKELRKGSYTYFADNDIIIAKITPCMENGKCALVENLENGLGFGSSEFHVVRVNEKYVVPKYIFLLLNRKIIRENAEKIMTGSSGHRRVPAIFYENLELPIPSLSEQQHFVAEIEKLEKIIAQAQATIAAAPAKKQAVMQHYL